MYTIAGATGRVGSGAARRLLADGEPVRVLVRDGSKGAAWSERGAEVAVVDLADRSGLTDALAGSRGFFALLPFNLAVTDFYADARSLADSITGAVADSAVPHVVMLSSLGADLAEGTGPIWGLHVLEEQLRGTAAVVSVLRSGHFQEKVTDVLDAARHASVYPVFADSADVPKPMLATGDIGRVVAQTLLSPPAASEVVDLDGPAYTERQVAAKLGAALGIQLEVVTIPQPGWVDALVDAGFSPHIAEVLAGLSEAEQCGILTPRGDRTVHCATELDETLAALVGAPV